VIVPSRCLDQGARDAHAGAVGADSLREAIALAFEPVELPERPERPQRQAA
jgi:hypothetical protein